MLAQPARRFLRPNYPGAGSVHALRREDTGLSPGLLDGSFICAPTFPASGQSRRRRGRKTPLTSFCQQLKLSSGLSQATSPRPQESALVGPRLCHCFEAREGVGRAKVKRRVVHGPRTQSWKGSDSGAHARSEGDWAEFVSWSGCREQQSAWRSGNRARAVVSPRPYARAVGATSFPQARPPLLLQRAEAVSRAGKCGARWAGRRTRARPAKEGRERERF